MNQEPVIRGLLNICMIVLEELRCPKSSCQNLADQVKQKKTITLQEFGKLFLVIDII